MFPFLAPAPELAPRRLFAPWVSTFRANAVIN